MEYFAGMFNIGVSNLAISIVSKKNDVPYNKWDNFEFFPEQANV